MSAAENLHRNLSYDNTLIGVVFSVVLIMIDESFQNSNTINECENSYLAKKSIKARAWNIYMYDEMLFAKKLAFQAKNIHKL